ncbi:MAG: hypothetical protein GF330_11780 [Candidatus Eisenbacteria bacterium]|nr:hypothetical protein [Candidatus Eisenbacteria bacterium]
MTFDACRTARAVLLLGVGLSITGCGKETPSGADVPTCPPLESFPGLAVGSWWIYERTEWESQVPDHVYEYMTSVESADSVASGRVAYRLREDEHARLLWLQLVDCELRMYAEDPRTARDYTVPLRTPIETDARWPYSTISSGGYSLEAQIVSVTDTLRVPAGTFAGCVHVRVAPYYDTWISLSDGVVAAEYREIGGDRGWRDELLEYELESSPRSTLGAAR